MALKKIYSLIVLVLAIYICASFSFHIYTVNNQTEPSANTDQNDSRNNTSNFVPDDNLGFGDIFIGFPRFVPYFYDEPIVNVSFAFTPIYSTQVEKCSYKITDCAQTVIANETLQRSSSGDFFSGLYSTNKTLTNLSNGNYALALTVYYTNGTIRLSLNRTFTVDTTFIEPKLTVISPQNQTYNTNEVDLIYNINSKIVWSYYNLDDKECGMVLLSKVYLLMVI